MIRRCVVCRKYEGIPFKFNVTPDFPDIRVDNAPPFTHTGIDFAGPLLTKGLYSRGSSAEKAYICLFTCASTRAVHLELVESLDVQSFIRCFRRFCARRGMPRTLISDNAKTFQTVAKEVKNLIRSPRLGNHLSSRGIRWHFIVERSPWQGGIWERLIRSVKRCLIKVVGRGMLNFMEVSTLLVEIECIINARPITYIYDDTEGVSYPLTPSQLINGRNLLQEPNESHFEIVNNHEALSKRARYHRKLLEHFTQRWRKEYLVSLMEAYKSKQVTKQPLISVGDVCILKNDQAKRAFWKLCKVSELLTGKDGNVRAARVEVTSSRGKHLFRRPIQHLVPLEIRANFSDLHTQPQAKDAQAQAQENSTPAVSIDNNAANAAAQRPKRNAAIIGILRRQDGLVK